MITLPLHSVNVKTRSTIERNHYAALDGLRGFAAISVVLFHIGHWLHVPTLATNSRLAVDFFFCLSGYVLALAYQHRFDAGMTTANFLRIRLIRLMPLIFLGTIVSFLFVVFKIIVKHEFVPPMELGIALFLGLINFPYFGASKFIGGPQVFPLNGPQYSLFLEIAVNLFWSVTRRIRQLEFALAVAAISLIGVMWVGLGGDTTATFLNGIPRVGVSFFLGIAIFHFDRRTGNRLKSDPLFWAAAIVMVLLFYYPRPLPFAVNLLWIVVVAPVLVLTGARASLTVNASAVALFMGELSYPVYVLHYPIFCWVNGLYLSIAKGRNLVIESVIIVAAVLIGGYVGLRLFDQPIRRALSRRTGRASAA